MGAVGTPRYLKLPIVSEEASTVLAEMPALVLSGAAASHASNATRHCLGDLCATDASASGSTEAERDEVPLEPDVHFAELANGVRIAAVDRGGLCSSIGLFVHSGSRYEQEETACLPHALELMAFRSSGHLSQLRTLKTLEQLGAAATCRVGREDILYQVDSLREYVPVVLPLMLANLLCPSLLPEEVSASHDHVLEVQQNIQENPETLLCELLHVAGYKGNTLGNHLYANEKDIAAITPENIQNFIKTRCTPDRLILVGVNVDFDELCKWTARSFAEQGAALEAPAASLPAVTPAVYTGGDLRIEQPNPLCHLMLGWEVEKGWNGPSLAAVTVLQMFLGGGGSFSTGGPGKGMHTRLYTEVLNRHPWVESCQASSVMYADSGLFTIYATVVPKHAGEFIDVLMRIFTSLKSTSEVELQRAKNALKSSIHMNLEMRAVMMEDVGRQLVLAGKVGTAREFGRMIDAVTAADLLNVLRQCLKTQPTVVSFGAIESVPSYEQIQKKFANGIP